jgi:hypothetical protein
MYDKMGSVLRVETTTGNPGPYKVFRSLSNEPDGQKAWRPMRKGIADLHRRAQISQQANETYLESLAATEVPTPLADIFDAVSAPRRTAGRRVRALRLNDPGDVALLDALEHGEFVLAGFRNKDLRQRIYPTKRRRCANDERRLSARISRQLRLLRDHGLIRKVPKSYRYQLTDKGTTLVAALQAVRNATLERLDALAA